MSGKSRQRKGKFKQKSKSRKGRRSHQVAVSGQEATPRAEEAITSISEAAVSSPAIKAQIITKNPEILFELRRIGILAAIMLTALILLAIFLG
jgi:hypothetical protein